MNGTESVTDPALTAEASANGSFQIVRRGYDPVEVQAFARAVSSELRRLSLENQELRARVKPGGATAAEVAAVADGATTPGQTSVAQYVGSETTRLLQAARDTAAGIVRRAEERAQELVDAADADARRIRDTGVADAAHERRVAADEARRLIADATEQRRAVLAELARRRDVATTQLRDLLRGREVLVQAITNVAGSSTDLLQNLESISSEPVDFINLDPDVPDHEAGSDRGAVLKVQFAPPAPGAPRLARPLGSGSTTSVTTGPSMPRRMLNSSDASAAVYVLES